MPSRSRRNRSADTSNNTESGSGDNAFANVWDWFLDLFREEEQEPAVDHGQEETPILDTYQEVYGEEEGGTGGEEEVIEEVANELDGPEIEEAVNELDGPAAEEAQAVVEEATFQKSGDIDKVELSAGSTYKVTADDMAQSDPWTYISRNHGMKPELLQAFNQHVADVSLGGQGMSSPVELAAGTEIYIPSAQEILFGQCRQKAASYDEAVTLYGQLAEGPNVKMMDAARSRASGDVGEGYGVEGTDSGRFYTPNPDLAGASSRRSSEINGQTEYKVFWVSDFWKCSVFMHDAVWQAGYKPHMTGNDHYLVAGKLQQSQNYTEVLYNKAQPGDCFQRYGGTGSNESHNAILSDFPKITDLGDGNELVEYDIIGAEYERAAEGYHETTVKKGTSEVVSGYGSGGHIRFFRPSVAR